MEGQYELKFRTDNQRIYFEANVKTLGWISLKLTYFDGRQEEFVIGPPLDETKFMVIH